ARSVANACARRSQAMQSASHRGALGAPSPHRASAGGARFHGWVDGSGDLTGRKAVEETLEPDSAPVWLSEEPEILALLHAVLDRYDAQPSDSRQRDVSLNVSRFLPSLARADATADQLWSFVQALEGAGVLRIRRGRRSPYDPDWTGARLAFNASAEPRLRAWLGRAQVAPELARWRAAVLAHASAFPGGCDALLARRIAIPGR